jgi:hypothetical protein
MYNNTGDTMSDTYEAAYCQSVTVKDTTGNEVELMVYQDRTSGGVFAIDASFILDLEIKTVISPFNKSQVLTLVGD